MVAETDEQLMDKLPRRRPDDEDGRSRASARAAELALPHVLRRLQNRACSLLDAVVSYAATLDVPAIQGVDGDSNTVERKASTTRNRSAP